MIKITNILFYVQIKEYLGSESREFERHKEKWEERAKQEEELFVRAPISKQEKKRERYLLKKRDGYVKLDFLIIIVTVTKITNFFCLVLNMYF